MKHNLVPSTTENFWRCTSCGHEWPWFMVKVAMKPNGVDNSAWLKQCEGAR